MGSIVEKQQGYFFIVLFPQHQPIWGYVTLRDTAKRKYAALGIENRILDSILIPIVNCLFDGGRLLRKSS